MTIEYIKCLTDWKKTLNSRSVHAMLKESSDHPYYGYIRFLRIIGVGRKYVKVLHNNGKIKLLKPEQIVEIIGL